MSWLIILIIVILLLFIWNQNYERFEENIMGYEEGLPLEYRNIDRTIRTPMWNRRAFRGLNWDLRYPYTVRQKYSYVDYPKCGCDKSFYGYAKLRELPLELQDNLTTGCGCNRRPRINQFPINCQYGLSTNSLTRLGNLSGVNENTPDNGRTTT